MSELNVTITGKGTSFPCAHFTGEDFSDILVDQSETSFDLELSDGWSSEPWVQLEALGRYLMDAADMEDGDIILSVMDDAIEAHCGDTDRLTEALTDFCDIVITKYFPDMESASELLSLATSHNTYNHEQSIAGAINYTVMPLSVSSTDCFDECLIIWEVNTGGDPRGGYGVTFAGFFPGGVASSQLISPCIDAYITDDKGEYLETDAGCGYHGACSFERIIDNGLDEYTVQLDEHDCPVFEGDSLVLVDDSGNKALAHFQAEFVDC